MDHLHSEQISVVPQSSRRSELGDDSYNGTPISLSNNGDIEQAGGSSPSKASTREDRVRPTTYNPLYGLVEGVKRGSTDWSAYKNYDQYMQLTYLNIRCSSHETALPCRDRLKKSCITFLTWNGGHCRARKSRYVNYWLFLTYQLIWLQCERVSKETNGWLLVAAQHPNSTGQFIHYASSRLRREAKDDTKELVKQFQTTINSLMTARRKDALEMGRALEISRQELVEKEEEVRRQGDEIRDKDALLAKYKDILGIKM